MELFGPRALRANDAYLPNVAGGLPHARVRVDALEELMICDYGNAPIDFGSTHRSIEPIRGIVREIAGAGTLP